MHETPTSLVLGEETQCGGRSHTPGTHTTGPDSDPDFDPDPVPKPLPLFNLLPKDDGNFRILNPSLCLVNILECS